MKKVLVAISSIFFASLALAPVAFAQSQSIGNTCAGGTFGNLCSLQATDIGHIIGAVINFIFLIAAIIALIFLVIGGLKWVTSEGDTKNVEAARNQIIAAAIGLGVTFLSYLAINFLLNFFLHTSLSNLTIPQL